MGRAGSQGEAWTMGTSGLPAEISALPLGQGLAFSLDDGLNVHFALETMGKLEPKVPSVLGIPAPPETQVLLSRTLHCLGQGGKAVCQPTAHSGFCHVSPISLGSASGDGLSIGSPVPPWHLGFVLLKAVRASSSTLGWGSVRGITRCSREEQAPRSTSCPATPGCFSTSPGFSAAD